MLVVSRRIGESIQIGDQITVTIVDIKGKQVRFGISAPEGVSVHRAEVYERIQAGLQGSEQDEPEIVHES